MRELTMTIDEKIEKISRLLCIGEGWNPDATFHPGEPLRVRNGFLVSGHGQPLWTAWSHDVERALSSIEKIEGDGPKL
jgi:hypothetical protein